MTSNPRIEAIMAPDVSPEGHIRRYLTSVSPYRDKLARAGAQRFDQGLHDEPLGHAGHHRFSSLTRSARESRSDNVQDLTWAADFIKEGAVLAGPIKRAAKVGKPNDDWKDYEGMDPDTADRLYARKVKRRELKVMRRGRSPSSSRSPSPPHQTTEAARRHRAASVDVDTKRIEKYDKKRDKENETNAIMINYKAKNVQPSRLTLKRKLPSGKGLFARGVASVQMPVPSQARHEGSPTAASRRGVRHPIGFDQEAFLTKQRVHRRSVESSPSVEWERRSEPSGRPRRAEMPAPPLPVTRRRYAPGELPSPGKTGSPSWPTVISTSHHSAPPRQALKTLPVVGRASSLAPTSTPRPAATAANLETSASHSTALRVPTRTHSDYGSRRAYGQIIPLDLLPVELPTEDEHDSSVSLDLRNIKAVRAERNHERFDYTNDVPSPRQEFDTWQPGYDIPQWSYMQASAAEHQLTELFAIDQQDSTYGSPVIRTSSRQLNPFVAPPSQLQYGFPETYALPPQLRTPRFSAEAPEPSRLFTYGPQLADVPATPAQQLSSHAFRFSTNSNLAPPLETIEEGLDSTFDDPYTRVLALDQACSYTPPRPWNGFSGMDTNGDYTAPVSSTPRPETAPLVAQLPTSPTPLTTRTTSSDAVDRYGTTLDDYKRLFTARKNIL